MGWASGTAAPHGVGWNPSGIAVSSWSMLAETITVPFSELVLLILQWAHSHSGGHRVPKGTVKRQVSLCKHFTRLCLQCKVSHVAKPNFNGWEIISTSWWEELQRHIAKGQCIQGEEESGLFLQSITEGDSLIFFLVPLQDQVLGSSYWFS